MFSKGNIPWNKGKPHSEETREKMSKKAMGRTISQETVRKMIIANKYRASNMQIIITRFLKKVKIIDNNCWEWQAYKDHLGYGMFSFKGKPMLVHRFMYEYFHDQIQQGLELDHLCRNPSCVNPIHLEAVTHLENLRRGSGLPALNSRKTHCKYGHEFTPDNIRRRSNGGRECRICIKEYHRKRWLLMKHTKS